MSFQRSKLRRFRAARVYRYQCRCGKAIILWKDDATKVSHETPVCDWFRHTVDRIAQRCGTTTFEGANYWAALIVETDDAS